MIAANSWFLCTLIGLGIIPVLLLMAKNEWVSMFESRHLIHTVALLLTFGLLLDHAIGILTGDLKAQSNIAWTSLIGFAAAIALAVRAYRGSQTEAARDAMFSKSTIISITLTTATVSAVSLAVFAEPLVAWDARSIWFFHAKAIFFDGGLRPSSFWLNDAYNWSHKYYPQLASMLAARYADFMLADWNEYAPKGVLVPLAVSSMLGLLVFYRNWKQLLFVLLAVVTLLGDQLTNGYQDGWLALYGCIAILALARWSSTRSRKDLALGCAAVAMTLCLKNEGQLLFVAALIPFLYGTYLHKKHLHPRDAAVAAVFLPFIFWVIQKPRLPTGEGLQGGGLIGRAMDVVFEWPELLYRLSVLVQTTAEDTFLLETALAFIIVGVCAKVTRHDLLIGAPTAIYTVGLVAVYLGTPYDFNFHVQTSLDRVTLFPTLLLLLGLIQMTARLLDGMRYMELRTLITRSSSNN